MTVDLSFKSEFYCGSGVATVAWAFAEDNEVARLFEFEKKLGGHLTIMLDSAVEQLKVYIHACGCTLTTVAETNALNNMELDWFGVRLKVNLSIDLRVRIEPTVTSCSLSVAMGEFVAQYVRAYSAHCAFVAQPFPT